MDVGKITSYAFAERYEEYLLIKLHRLCRKSTLARLLPVVPLIAAAHVVETTAQLAECYFKGLANVLGYPCIRKCHFKVGVKMLTIEGCILGCYLLAIPILAIVYQWNLLRKGEGHVLAMLEKLKENESASK